MNFIKFIEISCAYFHFVYQ